MVCPQIDISKIAGKYAPLVKRGWVELDKLKREKKLLKWWQIFKKRDIDFQVAIIKHNLGGIGIVKGFEDLEKWGILKRSKSN